MAFENTNPWAAYFAQDAEKRKAQMAKAQAKAAATRLYMQHKPQAILDLEKKTLKTYDDRTANGLTTFILDWLHTNGHYGARINIGGIYLADKGAYRASGSTKGVADIIACIHGRFCQFEVKAGKDRPRQDQLTEQTKTRAAGGIYEFIHNATEFVEVAQRIKSGEQIALGVIYDTLHQFNINEESIESAVRCARTMLNKQNEEL